MEKNNNVNSGGIGFFGMLTILFVALKLTGVIDWHWAWIVAPVWIPLVLGVLILLGYVIYKIIKE